VTTCVAVLLSVSVLSVGCIEPVEPSGTDLAPAAEPVLLTEAAARTSWTVTVDPRVPEAQYLAVIDAMSAWKGAVPCDLEFTVSRGPTRPIEAVLRSIKALPEAFTIEVGVGDVPGGDWGYASWDPDHVRGSWVVFDPAAPADTFLHVPLHELGHGFGISHATTGLMEQGTVWTTVTPGAAAAYASLWCSAR